MATTMVESWAVDLATIGPIYPWVGSEVVLWSSASPSGSAGTSGSCASRAAPTRQELRRLNSPDKIERAMRDQRLP